jgi:RNA polymerase sigma-70 factor, ECF subfamily
MQTVWRVTRNQADAEDAIQAALSTAWRRREVIAIHPNPAALMLKICIDASLDLVKKRKSTRRTLERYINGDFHPACSTAPPEYIESQESVSAILSEIHQLPRNLSEAILMRLVNDLPYSEIASVLECTEVAARKYVQRGRSLLQARLRCLDPDQFTGGSR